MSPRGGKKAEWKSSRDEWGVRVSYRRSSVSEALGQKDSAGINFALLIFFFSSFFFF